MRALVISDTHFGAWTGEDILSEPETLALLEPHLDVDEVILLGDMFDFMFGSLRDAFKASEGLLELLRGKLQGKRFVFLAGNHDHHMVSREAEELLGLALATGKRPNELHGELRRADFFRRLLERQLAGVEVDIRYPTYMVAGVLCTHGHYLDFHARRSGAAPGRLLARALWSIAVGGQEHTPGIEDYEATITLLTSLLYTIAQLPNGTQAQRRAFAVFEGLERAVRVARAPAVAMEHGGDWVESRAAAVTRGRRLERKERERAGYRHARVNEAARRRRTGAPTGGEAASHAVRLVNPSDAAGAGVAAFEQVVTNLGWAAGTDKIVFAHTHQALDGVPGPAGSIRYWNTGSWIYEPDLSSREAYLSYLRNGWPGTAVLIDSDEPQPRLLRLREHLNPLHQMTEDDDHPRRHRIHRIGRGDDQPRARG
ncbi:MAG: metallophosphoesterase [Solirubrobacterales bacterium]|nr:metallophosphoesterase [Solirubrobacterales bacterium]